MVMVAVQTAELTIAVPVDPQAPARDVPLIPMNATADIQQWSVPQPVTVPAVTVSVAIFGEVVKAVATELITIVSAPQGAEEHDAVITTSGASGVVESVELLMYMEFDPN
jgi:hypothetical protein